MMSKDQRVTIPLKLTRTFSHRMKKPIYKALLCALQTILFLPFKNQKITTKASAKTSLPYSLQNNYVLEHYNHIR